MSGVPQSKNELRSHLQEQLQFIRESCRGFDAGVTAEAKRIATAVRVLVHDTKFSRSLLGQLDLMGIPFRDTAVAYSTTNLIGSQCLLYVVMTRHPDGMMSINYSPPLAERNPGRFVPFGEWWSQIILGDGRGLTLTRRELILTLCEKDGGTHVDPELEAKYAAFSRSYAGAWVAQPCDGPQDPPQLVERFSARQVAHEILATLDTVGQQEN